MEDNRGYELEISDKTADLLDRYAAKAGITVEQAFEHVAVEYVQKQLGFIENSARETGKPLSELLDQQFAKALEYLLSRPQ